MYERYKLTLKNRVNIPVGAIVELEVNEIVRVGTIGADSSCKSFGVFHIRKQYAKKGLFQAVTTPFPDGFKGKPTIVVENRHVTPIEIMPFEEIGEFWVFCMGLCNEKG